METKPTDVQLDGMPGEERAGSQARQNPREEIHCTRLVGMFRGHRPESGGCEGLQIGHCLFFLKIMNKSFQILDCFHENPWFTYNSWHGNSWDRWMGSGNINWIQPSLPSTLSHSPCPFHLLRISGTSPCICPSYSTATALIGTISTDPLPASLAFLNSPTTIQTGTGLDCQSLLCLRLKWFAFMSLPVTCLSSLFEVSSLNWSSEMESTQCIRGAH